MPAISSLVQFANSSPVGLKSVFEEGPGLKKIHSLQVYKCIVSFTSGSEARACGFSTVLKGAKLGNSKRV